MFAKIRILLSISALLAVLAACSSAVPVDLQTPSSSNAAEHTTTAPVNTATQPSPAPAGFGCQNVQEISVEECQALVALYEGTNGADWSDNSGWLDNHHPCSWYGVICEQGKVVELQLYYNELSGSLPPEIGNLTHLRSLYLDSSQLSGPIPAEIGNLTELQIARLGDNQFSSIPAKFFQLDKLIELDLSRNELSGDIPGEFGNLSLLQQLKLNSNQFTGNIPVELGELTNLHHLDLSHNQLNGSIPATLGDLAVLDELDLSHNQLTGSIPNELGNLIYLYRLDLSYNELSGEVPVTLANARMADLRLWGNLLEGTIPASEEEVTIVEYGGVHFEIDSALVESVWREIVAAQPPSEGGPGWDVRPEHIRFTIVGPRELDDSEAMRPGSAAQPQIMIYPAQQFSAMSELARTEIEVLQSLLESRPSDHPDRLPFLPLINAAQVFHAQAEYLDFQNGSGVRFITQYSQDMGPINNQMTFYTFQGLTDDGAYYVAASFPIAAAGLSDEPVVQDWEAFSARYQDYLSETVSQLDALSSEEFEPDLKVLDRVIQSLIVSPP